MQVLTMSNSLGTGSFTSLNYDQHLIRRKIGLFNSTLPRFHKIAWLSENTSFYSKLHFLSVKRCDSTRRCWQTALTCAHLLLYERNSIVFNTLAVVCFEFSSQVVLFQLVGTKQNCLICFYYKLHCLFSFERKNESALIKILFFQN